MWVDRHFRNGTLGQSESCDMTILNRVEAYFAKSGYRIVIAHNSQVILLYKGRERITLP